MRRLFSLLILITTLVACSTTITGRRQFTLISEGRAISASKEAYVNQMAALNQEGLLVSDPRLVARIDTITGRLIAQAILLRPESADWEWSVEIIEDPETINAWCMAGGRMAIYTGLINQIRPTDDELAQIMGHEIAHALANHTAERMSIAMASLAGVVVVGVVSKKPGIAMVGAAAAAALAIKRPNSRKSETEADEIGIELAARAGYNPNAAVTLWRKMGAVAGEGPPEFLSTHPAPTTREENLSRLIPEMMPYYQSREDRPFYQLQRTRFVPPPQ